MEKLITENCKQSIGKGRRGLRALLGGALSLLVTLPATVGIFANSGAAHAQGQDWNAVVAAARKEGRVVWYTNTVPAVNERLKTAFEAAYPGIVVEYTRIVGGPITSKVDQEQQQGVDGADVVFAYQPLWMAATVKAGRFKPLAGPESRTWPAKAMMAPGVPFLGLDPFVIAYNGDSLKPPITGYRDFLRPDLKGKIGTTQLAAIDSIAWYEWVEATQGTDFLEKFAAQSPKLYPGSAPLTQAVASGEMLVAASTIMAITNPLIQKGAPLKIIIPKPAIGTGFGGAVLSTARRPNSGMVFLDYVMSVPGQTVIHGRGESASPLNVPGSVDSSTIIPFDAQKYTPDVVKASTARWERIFSPK